MSCRVPVNACLAALLLLASVSSGWGCEPPTVGKVSTPADIRMFFQAQRKDVLTFAGYAAAGYQDVAGMLARASEVLARYDPKRTIVNIGATAAGIGAVYEIAKQKGFQTTGIVSTLARDTRAVLSSCVDTVFFVQDPSWGGFLEGGRLSPTSRAMVDVSTELVSIGGGEVARDELIDARRQGKKVEFFPADMNHALARARALETGEPPPQDFRGSTDAVFGARARGRSPG